MSVYLLLFQLVAVYQVWGQSELHCLCIGKHHLIYQTHCYLLLRPAKIMNINFGYSTITSRQSRLEILPTKQPSH
jgi:hypothetical protein